MSEHARAMLSIPAAPVEYPPTDDTQAWLAHVAANDLPIADALPPTPDSAIGTERIVNGARVFVHRPKTAIEGGPVYLDFHPGGLIQLGGEACRLLGALTASWLNIEVWSVDYRMPPLNPYPAGLDDAVAVYRSLMTEHSTRRVIVAGVSAGGNIAAALLLRAHEVGLPMPAGLYLGTPEVDLTESGDSFVVNAEADNTLSSLREVNELYAGGHSLADPHLSPLFAEDLSFFPPTLLTTGTRDLFLSNTVRMHRALRQQGVSADLHVWEAMPHVGFGPGSPEDADLRAEVAHFIERILVD